jgi:hypothetical protein
MVPTFFKLQKKLQVADQTRARATNNLLAVCRVRTRLVLGILVACWVRTQLVGPYHWRVTSGGPGPATGRLFPTSGVVGHSARTLGSERGIRSIR